MFGALAYNQNKVDSEEAKVLFSNKMLLSEDFLPIVRRFWSIRNFSKIIQAIWRKLHISTVP